MFIFDINASKHNPYVVYLLYSSKKEIQFVGVNRFSNITSLTDAKESLLFDEIFPDGHPAGLDILSYHNNKAEAVRAQFEYLRKNGRPPMMRKMRFKGVSKAVVNVETGEKYSSVTQAAIAAKVSQSQMSKHLNKVAGYNTIQGKVYDWASFE